jgi:hypothetical protein
MSTESIKKLLILAKARDDMYTVAQCKLALLFQNPSAIRYCQNTAGKGAYSEVQS